MKFHIPFLAGGLLFSLALSAPLATRQVQALPLFYRYQERSVRQTFTPSERTENAALLKKLGSQPKLAAYIKKNMPNFDGIDSRDVVIRLKAAYRSPEPETLTVINLYESEPPIQLFYLSGNRYARDAAWVTEPKANFNLCGLDEGYTTRDVNLDGLREVSLVIGCGDGPWWGLDLFSYAWVKGELQLFGWFNVVTGDSSGGKGTVEILHELHVKKDTLPVIYSLVTIQDVEYLDEDKKRVLKQTSSVQEIPWSKAAQGENGKPYEPYGTTRLW